MRVFFQPWTMASDSHMWIFEWVASKEIFDLQERHDNMELNTNKFFSDNYLMDIFMFICVIVSLLTTAVAFPHNAETRNYVVFFSCRHIRDSINNTTNYHCKNSKIL